MMLATDTLRVIVADDHPLYRDGIARALAAGGEFDVVAEAGDGAAALKAIRELEPDVAVLDVRMPGMDGIEVLAALVRHGPRVPVVLLSAFEDAALARAGIEAGAAAYLAKSADRDTIRHEVVAAARAGCAGAFTDLGRPRLSGWAPRLTVREYELLALARAGWEKPELALLCGLDEPALRRRLEGLLAKLGADDLREAIERAVALEIIR